MIDSSPPPSDTVGLDRALLEQMLGMCGTAMRPALVAQLIADFTRLSHALQDESVIDLERVAHELKGLSATIGATALAENAARYGELAGAATASVRAALALGLCRQIEALCAVLRAQSPSAA